MIGLVGRKVGMTRVFTEEAFLSSNCWVEANRISQVKTLETDGYLNQVTTGAKKVTV